METIADGAISQDTGLPDSGIPLGPSLGRDVWDEAALSALYRELDEHLAWQQERHDLEMRQTALLTELNRTLGTLSALLARYDDLQLKRAAVEPPIPRQTTVPGALRPLVELTLRRVTGRGFRPPSSSR